MLPVVLAFVNKAIQCPSHPHNYLSQVEMRLVSHDIHDHVGSPIIKLKLT
jgi:hypothetical protein